MSFLFIKKFLYLNNLKTRTDMSARISVFVICVEAIIYLLLYNLHDCTFNDSVRQINKISFKKIFPRRNMIRIFEIQRPTQSLYLKELFSNGCLLRAPCYHFHCFFLPYPPIAAPKKLQSFFRKATYKIYFGTNMMQLLWSSAKYVNAWCYILNFYQEICFKITLPD